MTEEEIYQKIYDNFDSPCEYGWFNMCVNDEWCEKHCEKYPYGNWECWKHCFDGMSNYE